MEKRCTEPGQGAQNVVFLTVGTGIGGAVVIGGKLFNGFANRGTELGHVPLIANGEPCACGSVGCLEHYASTSALVRRFSKRAAEAGISFPGEEINGELIVRLYKEGDKLATECLDEHCDFLGHGIAGFINIFSPQRIVKVRTVRSRRLSYPESQRAGTPLCHSRLCREHSNHGCIFR